MGLLLAIFHLTAAIDSLQVDTTSGRVHGIINGSYPDVVQFLGIPFAEPPVGELRWAAPIPKSPMGRIDATRFGPDCPQYLSSYPSVYSVDTNEFNIVGPTSEDCLALSIWAPYTTSRKASAACREKLPVIVWIFGGDQQYGGGQVPYQNPGPWVQRSQGHIFVQIKFVH